jgi:hypothetical protein
MARKYTIFQNIDRAFSGDWNHDASEPHINSYDMSTADKSILYRTTNKDDYESKKLELQQNAYLKDRWIKANVDLSVSAYAGLNNVKLMYRDADLMDAFPEIGAALDIVTEESTITSDKGMIVNVYSKSDRIKSILEDLFVNRLNIQVTAPMVVRAMCKYGNQFMLLDIDNKLGVKGWKQLPVFNVERIENGIANPYGAITTQYNNTNNIDTSTKFIWVNENNSQVPFRNWQIAHFRLLTNSLYLPYGCLVGDTRIETEYGYKEIKNIKVGDKVWTFNLATQQRELSTVTMQMNKGEKDVYYVGTKHHSIEGTPDHKLLIFDKSNKKFKYKEIKDIQTDDLLVIFDGVKNETKKIKIDKSDLKDFEHGKKSLKWWDDYIKYIPEYITEDFAKLFGFMLGDGWVNHSMNVMFALGEYNTLNEEYIKLLEKYSGKKISFLSQKKNSNKKLKYHTAFVTSKMLATILKRMGFLGDCYTKRIPSWVFEANVEIKKSFLKGLIDADGSISIISKNSFGYTIELANEELVKDIKTLVMSLGLKCGNVHKRDRLGVVSKNKDGDSIIVKHYSYYINFCNKELHQVKRITPHIDSIKLEKIKNVKHIGLKETFDITVDNDNSNFFANGIVTHNCSYLNGARRHWRMLSLMEDLMLIYRLERSIERRVYKIYVGAIDDADVQAYVENIANNFKRTPIIDPMTGQLDLRKNLLSCDQDIFIPVRDQNAPTPIDTLSAAQNLTAMDDIKFVQNKVCTALRIPKTFLNFEEAQGNGNNLALEDIRFTRTVNRIQQAFLMELTKVASIHLYLLGFTDDLTNFNLTMNNPSTQAEQLEIDNLQKKITAARDAISDPGNGIPIMSQTRALKEIMKWSEKDIKDNLEEIRLEKGIAAELEKTSQIIKRTGLFDTVDRMYGEPGAEYQDDVQQQGDPMGGGGLGGGGGAPMGGGDFGSGLDDLGAPDSDENGDIAGAEDSEPTADMDSGTDTGGGDENAGAPPNESRRSRKPMLAEAKRKMYKKIIKESEEKADKLFSQYLKRLDEANEKKKQETSIEKADIYDKSLMINEEFNKMLNGLNKKLKDNNEKVD